MKETNYTHNYLKTYLFIKGFAIGKQYNNTLKALALSMRSHENQKRKSGEPYIIHPLRVCSQLISVGIYDDVTLASALLHDTFEDCGVNEHEVVDICKIDKEVSNIVALLTKQKGISEEVYYQKIKENPKALIIKLSDRCNNISTMQPFSLDKMQEYINETNEYIIPLCKYGKSYYPEYSNAITVLKNHTLSICETVQSFLDYIQNKK